jgi:hypothetical protein
MQAPAGLTRFDEIGDPGFANGGSSTRKYRTSFPTVHPMSV